LDDVFLSKLDATGAQEWSAHFGGAGDQVGWEAIEASDGGFVVVGTERVGGVNGWWAVLLAKTDASGTELWYRTYECPDGPCEAYAVGETDDGGYVIAGYEEGAETAYDMLLLKTDSNGVEQWRRAIGGEQRDLANDIVVADDGGFVLAGYTSSFGTGRTFYVVKTDAAGNEQWAYHDTPAVAGAKSLIAGASGRFTAVGKDVAAGGVVVNLSAAGEQTGMAWFDKPADSWTLLGAAKTRDGFIVCGKAGSGLSGEAFVMKADATWAPLWQFTSPDIIHATAVVGAPAGGYVFTGVVLA